MSLGHGPWFRDILHHIPKLGWYIYVFTVILSLYIVLFHKQKEAWTSNKIKWFSKEVKQYSILIDMKKTVILICILFSPSLEEQDKL